MTRLEKKCLTASAGMHLLLLLLLLFGSAFFVAKEKPFTNPRLQFVPSKFIEAALAGGGGNPKIARSDDVQKGNPLAPIPTAPPTAKPAPDTSPPAPAPKHEVKKPETKPEPPKVEKAANPKKPAPTSKPVETALPKPSDKPVPPKRKIDIAELKPIDHSQTEKAKAEAKARVEAQAREEAREAAREAARQANLVRQQLAQQLGHAADAVQRGLASGTKVEVGGPGGEAYANYGALVQAIYEAAWRILPDLNDDDFITVVRVVVSRDGRVTDSHISKRSGSALLDRSVQKAIDKVRADGLPPFPEFIKDAERSFTIEFNLKTKRLLG